MKSIILSSLLVFPMIAMAAPAPKVSFNIPSDWRGDSGYSLMSTTGTSAEDPEFIKGTDFNF